MDISKSSLDVISFLLALVYGSYIYILFNKLTNLEKRIFGGVGTIEPLAILFLIPGYIIAYLTKNIFIIVLIINTIIFITLFILLKVHKKIRDK